MNAFLPGIPFIHSGVELAEKFPINTGLDFTQEQLKHLPSEKLPLFSEYGYNWLNKENLVGWVRKVLEVRSEYAALIADSSTATFRVLHDSNHHILAFARVAADGTKRVAVVGNSNYVSSEPTNVKLDTESRHVNDVLSSRKLSVIDGHLHVSLHAGECLVFEY
jgi:hypothetical protein